MTVSDIYRVIKDRQPCFVYRIITIEDEDFLSDYYEGTLYDAPESILDMTVKQIRPDHDTLYISVE